MYALFAAEFPLAKSALDHYTNGFFLETVRMLVGGVLFLGYYLLVSKKKIKIMASDWLVFAQLILFYMYLSYFSSSWALQYMSSLKANIFASFMPFVSALLSYLILRDRPTMNRIVGMVIGAIGLIAILLTAETRTIPCGEFATISLPEIMMLVSIIATEYGYFLLKQLYDKGYPLMLINGVAMLTGGCLSLATGLVVFEQRIFTYTSLWPVVGYALLLFLLINVVDNALYGILIKRYSITFLTFASFLSPIFGVIYGTLFLGETISLMHFIAFGLIFFGLYLFARDEFGKPRTPEPPAPEQLSSPL